MDAQNKYLIYLIIASIIWVIPWKATALWRSARNGEKAWFFFLLILNTLGILEIIYIFFFSKNKNDNRLK